MNYTKEQVEKVIHAYHKWLGVNLFVTDDDGNPQDLQVENLNVYWGNNEDGDQLPFSDAVHGFFAEHVEVDEIGHPVSIPFEDTLKEVTP